MGPGTLSGTMKRMLEEGDVLRSGCHSGWRTVVPVLRLGIHPEMERPAILNRSIPSTAGATIGIPPARVVHDVYHWSLSAGRLSLVLAHRQVICLREALPHVRFKRLVTGVEHAHPVHSAI